MYRVMLTESELWTAINALRCAAAQYEKDADAAKDNPQMQPLGRQFSDQAWVANALADKLEALE